MGAPIIFICTREALAMLHREREIIRRAELLGITFAVKHPEEDPSDDTRHRMNVGTIGHIDHGKRVLVSALAESLRSVRLPDFKINSVSSISYGRAASGRYQPEKMRKQHEQDFRRKSKQLLHPTRNFCCRRR